MAHTNVGAAIHERTAASMLWAIRHADDVGVPAVWLTTGAGPDALTVFSAAAATTTTVRLGTAIVPTFPRHPLVVAQQAADIASLAPGRFTLGLGPSHAPAIEGRYGLQYNRPLENVREFVAIVKALLAGEKVDFDGKQYRVTGYLNETAAVPVIISALRERSFEVAGEIADGAVTWLCPAPYLAEVALPAMERGAAGLGRPRPKLVAHAFACLTGDPLALNRAVMESMGHYPKLANYQGMFKAAGYPEAEQGAWSRPMIDAVVISGDEASARQKVFDFLRTSGADELILSVLPAGQDRAISVQRTLDWIANL